MAEYTDGATTVNVTRLHRATPPLQGTFDVEIFGGRAEGSCNPHMTVTPSRLNLFSRCFVGIKKLFFF